MPVTKTFLPGDFLYLHSNIFNNSIIMALSLPLLLIFTLNLSLRFATCATSGGPDAYVSIAALPDWKNGHSCMAGCLWYNGLYANNPVMGGRDLGHGLDCGGDSAINGCYCRPDTFSTASVFISECVSSACSGGGAVATEISSAMSLYDGYCSTAALEQTVTSEAAAAAPTQSASTVPAPTTGRSTTDNAPARQTGVSEPTSSSSPEEEKSGLDKSDLIALGVGLGIGIPSLLIGLSTMILMRRRRVDRRSMLIER